MTTAAAAQTCESRILARAEADHPRVRGGAEAIADLGPATNAILGWRRGRLKRNHSSYVELRTQSPWKSEYPASSLSPTLPITHEKSLGLIVAREVNRLFLALYVKAQTFMADMGGKLRREDGAVATEYALLLVLIAIAIITAAIALGTAIAGVFQRGANTLGGVSGGTGAGS
jgi:Flp pilus assembly pilin Flp